MNRRLSSMAGALALAATALVSAGCGGGLDTEDAQLRCDQLRTSIITMTQVSYDDCVACHEECGDDCEMNSLTSPPTFDCAE